MTATRNPNPWLAVDPATVPAHRARELRRDWERFLNGDGMNGVRPPVADSWRRSLDTGVDPSGGRLAAVVVDHAEASERWKAHPLGQAAGLIRACLTSIADDSDQLIVVSDAAGMLLALEGRPRVRSLAADSINFTEGTLWSESSIGTNAIGTALAADHAVQIFAAEHFVAPVQSWACSAAPVHDPETGELLGVIDLTGLKKHAHPDSLVIVEAAARAVEGDLRRLQEREHRASLGGSEHVAGGRFRSASAAPNGRSQRLGGRRARRDELSKLAQEQAVLRRLATAVARGEPPAQIFQAVAEEVVPLLGADEAFVVRYESDRTATVVAAAGGWAGEIERWARLELDDSLAITEVFRTGRPARRDTRDYRTASASVAAYLRRAENHSVVANPIIVEGHLWGATVASTRFESLPADNEERLARFTDLVGIMVASAESRVELMASRARVAAVGDAARRRIQRDLHDGAQQRLVHTIITLKLARQALGNTPGTVVDLVEEALAQAERASAELRELAHGILPPALSYGGLRGGIDALVSRVRLPVAVEVTAERFPATLEAAAYFIVAEALTNVIKHASASGARITAVLEDDVLLLEVRDDGVGGATTNGSSGLLGLRDRAAALNGELRIESPPGGGTVVSASLPIRSRQAA